MKSKHFCNMERYEIGLCNKPAIWENPRWPNGYFCDEHKQKLSYFVKTGWTKIDINTGAEND